LGGNPIIAPSFIPLVLTHIKDHIGMWYVTETVRYASQAAGMDVSLLMDSKDPEVDQEFDRMLAATSEQVNAIAGQTLGSIPPVIQQAIQFLQSMSPQPQDPAQVAMVSAQAQQADVQRKAQEDQVQAALDKQKIEADLAAKMADLQTRERINREDNQTAMLIAASEIEAGHRTNIKTGTALGHGE